MLVIRLARKGRKNNATFRIVLQEKGRAPKSSAIEILGSYNPHLEKREEQISLKEDRIKHWLSEGAQASNTVHNMLVEFNVIEGSKKRSVQPKLKPQEEGEEKGSDKKQEAPAEKKEKIEEVKQEAPTEDKKEDKPAEVKEEKESKPEEDKPQEEDKKKEEAAKEEKAEEAK